MKRSGFFLGLLTAAVMVVSTTNASAFNFGDFRSETLVKKAWEAMNNDDIEAVLAYTNKVMELYGEQARKMQETLDECPSGSNEEIFSYWALNDVATALFIQGEAYRKADMTDEAVEAYESIVDEFACGQTYDTQGWFWKPADAAQEKLTMIQQGINIDFGDYTSSYMTTQAWKALNNNNLEEVLIYTDKVLELYKDKAEEMQAGLNEYAWESKEQIFSYWALNDVGTSLFIRGEALKKAGREEEAIEAYQELIDDFYYAQCWDPKGWFWKPAEAAQQSLDELSV
jgi:tetratricopeptide (TPR) repeat protein